MSQVTVLFFGGLRDALACSRELVQLQDDARSLAVLYRELCQRHPRLPSMIGPVRLAVNEEFLPGVGDEAFGHFVLSDGDVVALIPPVTGG